MLQHHSDLVFLAGFVIYVATRGVFAHRVKTVETIEKRVGGIEVVLLVFVMIGSLLLPILYLFTPVLNFADYPPPVLAQWAGAVVLLAALWLFRRSHIDLGKNWSPTLEIRKEHRLITHGVYQSIRHPMYAAILLFSVAQACLLHNWLAGYAAFVTFLPLYLVRAPREERMMRDRFGEEYEAYAQRTGRMIPKCTTK
ncbi:MAG: isoprenylcysteine carboxylmethyltransferase family protein [Phycisphaerales bacterium]|nr:isoprenylcysteine carboxylmethyltransferase family protein [Phycisphaerales bacterium]MCB9856488.1 isoprenylcysteine carboxylmethyltransferase family protein [Phycisphaerales bacterium]MCB9863969.1 isoprenylcysteine carboxylmethyltransferase family protein [Phycisphaerales bacterium]